MPELSDLCAEAVKIEDTRQVYRCEYRGDCEHQVHIFDHNLYCRVPLRPDKYVPKFRRESEEGENEKGGLNK